MFTHPSLRKGAITDPASVPFINYPDSVYIQDDQFADYSQLQFNPLDQARLQSPFQYHHQNLNFQVSPPSSVPSSPSSSASSISHFPATTAASADYSVFDGSSSFEAPSMTPASSYNPEIHVQQSNSPQQSYLPYNQQFVFDNSMLAQQQFAPNHGWENIPRMPQYNQQTPSSSARSPNSYNRAPYNSAPTKPLPTPVHTPVQQNYLTPQFQKTDAQDGNYYVPENQHSEHSHAPSVSTVSHNSPVTPQNNFEDVDEKPAPDYNASNGMSLGIPKLNRTITDVYQDELFNPTVMQTPQAKNNNQNLHAPSYHNIVANRLQAANQGHLSARGTSPGGSIQRERSPFRQNSPMAAEYNDDAFRQQHALTSVPTSQPGMTIQQQAEPQTISPKDAVLSDFNQGEDQMQMPYQPDFNVGDALGLRQENFQSAPNFPSMDSFPAQFNQPQQFNFQNRRPSQSNNYLHQTPEFPASLPRFESTGSDVYNDMSPTLAKTIPQRPQNTSADGGTYTCTYHGCTHRFESPAKLQKHKREAHRQTTPGGHLVGRTSDAASRNSQAGPHKCLRPNPSTGKPCNSIFSRPYDLTRHEDTIHNARKQKVRCHLCTEEKTFSRNDALTRHMRVVHPEVDWPGKQRRRGRE